MIRDILAAAISDALGAIGVDPVPERIHLERPARREHGDWSSNVALATAKAAGRNPRELAQQLADTIAGDPPTHVETVEIAGPGFVNFRLADSWLHDVLGGVIAAGPGSYGRSTVGEGTKVNIEFVSANPTGPLHAGHGRGACYGDALARLLAWCGHDVHRECYLNDRGVQMRLFAESLAARAKGEEPPEDGYLGQYVIDWAADLPDGADPLEWGYERALADQRDVLDQLHIDFDTWFSERSMVDRGDIDRTIADLRDRGVVYDDDGATWLRSTDYGDDKDRVLIKSDGEFTYLLPDIAYHRDKFARGFDLLINVWGADHHGYVARMKAAMQALGHEPDELEVQITQLVNLLDGGEEVRIGKRTGKLVELRDILDEVGADPARLTYSLQSIDSPQTFDFAEVKAEGMDNPVFYVQMAYARVRSIQRNAAEAGVERTDFAEVDRSLLSDERELDVLRVLSELPETIEIACAERAPHRVTTWVRELASSFHSFYNACYVVSDDNSPELTQARLWLVEAASVGLAVGLHLLGVSAPDRL